MTIVHVVEPFAAGVSVFVKYLTETMPDDMHIIIHGERKQVMSAANGKKNILVSQGEIYKMALGSTLNSPR